MSNSNTVGLDLQGGQESGPADQPLSQRVLIQVAVDTIPGEDLRRPTTLWELFCKAILHRDQRLHDGFDIVHVPGGFDSQEHVRRWFLYDVGVIRTLTKDEIMLLPHKAYRATKNVQDEWVFKEYPASENSIIARTDVYRWVHISDEVGTQIVMSSYGDGGGVSPLHTAQ